MEFPAILSFLAASSSSVSAFAPHFGTPKTSTTELAARKPFISGNWKLNPQTRDEAIDLASSIAESIGPDSPDADVALFVPYVFIESAMGAVGDKLQIGAEVSPLLLDVCLGVSCPLAFASLQDFNAVLCRS